MIAQLANGRASALIISQAVTDELLPSFGDKRLWWKAHLSSIEHNLMLQDVVLSLAISKWPSSVHHLEVDDTYTPHIHFVAYSDIIFSHKALWRQVPIRACALARQFHTVAFCLSFDYLAETEVGNFGVSVLVLNEVSQKSINRCWFKDNGEVTYQREHFRA